jgi:hypothetical protein
MVMSRFVAVPDIQLPYQDDRALEGLLEFIAGQEWDAVLMVGDELDAPEPSRWNKNSAGEFAGTLQRSIDKCHDLLGRVVEAAGGSPVHLMRSNHQERIERYLSRYAPALSSLRCLDYATLLGLDELGITFHRKPYLFTRENGGWWLAHGDEGSLIRTPGGTAMGLARRFQGSVLCGHTHKLGLQHDHAVVNGRIQKHVFGVECGHVMDLKRASYLSAGYGNWQQGTAVIEDGFPVVLPIHGGKVITGG